MNFIERQVDGIIYMGVTEQLHLDPLISTGTPVVVFTHADSDGRASSVRIDEHAASRTATQHLIEHGYADIGITAGPQEMMNTYERLNGWKQALHDAGLAIDDENTHLTALDLHRAALRHEGRQGA